MRFACDNDSTPLLNILDLPLINNFFLVDDCTNTGTTGDSGFSDVKPFLKTSLDELSSLETQESVADAPTNDHNYQKLNQREVKFSYYKTALRTEKYKGYS